MREVAIGVHELALGPVSNAFLVAGDTPTLVDCGLPGNTRRILDAAAAAGVDGLTTIAITHHHVDHIGSLASIVSATGATLYAPIGETPIIEGTIPAPPLVGRSAGSRLMLALSARFGPRGAAPAHVDVRLKDGDKIPGGLLAVATPGHTMGHMSYLHPASGTLFVGDAAANLFGRIGPPVGDHDEDVDAAARSVAALASIDFETACFGHGRTIAAGAKARLGELAERMAQRAGAGAAAR